MARQANTTAAVRRPGHETGKAERLGSIVEVLSRELGEETETAVRSRDVKAGAATVAALAAGKERRARCAPRFELRSTSRWGARLKLSEAQTQSPRISDARMAKDLRVFSNVLQIEKSI
jgi:hypothetical protein